MSAGKTVVIDYQTGNLNSACKSLRAVGADLLVTQRPEDLKSAARIVLPGVGHFASTQRLITSGICDALRQRVGEGIPFLGICVGLQWLFAGSTEAPETPGLGVFPEVCERFPAGIKSPHVGWNSLELVTRIATVARPASFSLRIFHPLLSSSRGKCNRGCYKLWRRFLGRRRKR